MMAHRGAHAISAQQRLSSYSCASVMTSCGIVAVPMSSDRAIEVL
jgi:hypothetical protein